MVLLRSLIKIRKYLIVKNNCSVKILLNSYFFVEVIYLESKFLFDFNV